MSSNFFPNEAIPHKSQKEKEKRHKSQNSHSILGDIFSVMLFLDTELPWYITNTEFLAVIKWQAPTYFDLKYKSFEFFQRRIWTKNIWVFVFKLYFSDYFWPNLPFGSCYIPPLHKPKHFSSLQALLTLVLIIFP